MCASGLLRCLNVPIKAHVPQPGVLCLAHFQPGLLPLALSSAFCPPSQAGCLRDTHALHLMQTLPLASALHA